MGLGDEWRASDVWFKEHDGAPDELHVRGEHVRGRAVECPACHRRCGVYDTRERTWRHLDIWQYETIVHCAVPRADCPGGGVHTCRMPWEVRPDSHFTALFEAQVLVMAPSGMTASAMVRQVRESDSRVWGILNRAASEARGAADYSGVACVGIDDTARRRSQSYISTMTDLDGQGVVAVTQGRDKGVQAGSATSSRGTAVAAGQSPRPPATWPGRTPSASLPRCRGPPRAWSASTSCSSSPRPRTR